MHKEKFMIYRRDAKKGEATYSPKSHSAPGTASTRRMMEPMKPSLTKPGTKAVIMAEEPSTWIFPRSGSLYLTMSSSNESSPLLQLHIMALP